MMVGFISQKEQEHQNCGAAQRRGGKGWGVVTLGRKKKTDLFVNRVTLSENKVAAEQPRKKGILCPLFPAVQLPLEKQECLIDRDKFAEIRRVQLRCAEDGFEARRPAGTRQMISASSVSRMEEEGRTREATPENKTYSPRPNRMAMISA
jgi:hypothetical protein